MHTRGYIENINISFNKENAVANSLIYIAKATIRCVIAYIKRIITNSIRI